MLTMIDVDLFDTDERILINKAFEGFSLKEFTRQRFIEGLSFSLNINTDDMVLGLVEGLKSKVVRLTDEEWDAIKKKLPLEVLYTPDDNVDIVPLEENEE